MKKIFLSIAALTFGASVTFAQTELETPETQESPQTEDLQIERLSNSAEAEEAGKKKIEMSELPEAVQQAFQESEFKDWEVAEINEVSASEESTTAIPAEGGDVAYEISLISKDMKDEISDTEEAIEEEKEDALEEGESAEISTEKVNVEIPAVMLKYDKEGQLLGQEEQKGEAEEVDQLEK